MKTLTITLVAALLIMPLALLHADDEQEKAKSAGPPEFATITDDPKLPRVLLMGDSVSIAYALEVRKLLSGRANVHRVPANCGSTKTALGSYGLVRWLPDAKRNGMSSTSTTDCTTCRIALPMTRIETRTATMRRR